MKKIYKNLLVVMITLLLTTQASFAQELRLESGTLEISGNSTFRIYGSFSGGAGSQTTNTNSIFSIDGDWTIDPLAGYTSTGTEEFFGFIQHISGPLSGFYHLGFIKRNPTLSGSVIILMNDIDADSIDLGGSVAGRVDAGQNGVTLYILSGSYTAMKGGNDSVYFDPGNYSGWLKWFINDITIGHTYTFYIGNSDSYRATTLQMYNLRTTGPGPISLSLFYTGTPGTINYTRTTYCGGLSYNCLADNKVIMTATGNHDYMFSIAITGKVPCDSAGAHPVLPFYGQALNVNTFQTDAVNESHSFGNMDSNYCNNVRKIDTTEGEYALGGKYESPLPVELTAFNAVPVNNDHIHVSWNTASELNCDYFYLTRSTDGGPYEIIGVIKGNGTTPYSHEYYFDDSNAIAGIQYYYQLQQVDFNQTKHPSNIIKAQLIKDVSGFILRPNLTKGTVYGSDEFSGTLYDVSGRALQTFFLVRDFDISNYANGMYFFIAITADGLMHPTCKITLQK